jgi:hypothetical protein
VQHEDSIPELNPDVALQPFEAPVLIRRQTRERFLNKSGIKTQKIRPAYTIGTKSKDLEWLTGSISG